MAHSKGQRAALKPHNVLILAKAPADPQAPRVVGPDVPCTNLRESGSALQQASGGSAHQRRRGQGERASGDSIFNCEAPPLTLRTCFFNCGLLPLSLHDTETSGVDSGGATSITGGDHCPIRPASIDEGEHEQRLGMEELSANRPPQAHALRPGLGDKLVAIADDAEQRAPQKAAPGVVADEDAKLVSRGPPDVQQPLERKPGLPQALVRQPDDPAGPLEG